MPIASTRGLFPKWRKWIQRIKDEQVQDLLINHAIFGQLNEMTSPYVGTTQGGDLQHWMTQNYIAFSATAIRRIVEKKKGGYASLSLRILLEELAENAPLLSRERFRTLYPSPIPARIADRDFNGIARNKAATHVSAKRIRRDLRRLNQDCRPIGRLTNKLVAHTELDRRKIGRTKHRHFDVAIATIKEMLDRYWLLLNGRNCPLPDMKEIDTRDDLKRIWPDRHT